MRADEREEIRKAGRLEPEVGDRAVRPGLAERAPAGAAEVDRVERAGDGVEARRVHDRVEPVSGGRGADPRAGDPHDRGLPQIDQLDVLLVERLVVAGLERNPPGPEPVVLRDELPGERGVLHSFADLAGDELAQQAVRRRVDEDVAVVREPDPEARLGVALFPEGLALRRRHVAGLQSLGVVKEAAEGLAAAAQQVRLRRLDPPSAFGVDRRIVQRGAPVGRALENGEVARRLGDLLDHLHARGARADHPDAPARHVEARAWPAGGVEGRPREVVPAVDGRQRRPRALRSR